MFLSCPPFAHHSAGLCQWNLCPLVPVPTWGHMESIHQGRQRSRRALHSASRTFRLLCVGHLTSSTSSHYHLPIISISSPLSPTYLLPVNSSNSTPVRTMFTDVMGKVGQNLEPDLSERCECPVFIRFLQWSPDITRPKILKFESVQLLHIPWGYAWYLWIGIWHRYQHRSISADLCLLKIVQVDKCPNHNSHQ